MAVTGTADVAAPPSSADAVDPPRRPVVRRRNLPGGRALTGGFLVALAGVATLLAWQQATGTPDTAYAVAVRDIHPGETVAAEDVRTDRLTLSDPLAAAAFAEADAVVGRVALGPIGGGELFQRGQLSEPGGGEPVAEVSFALDRDRAVDGRLRSGDRIDVYVTQGGRTEQVARGLVVVAAGGGDGTSFAGDRRVTVTVAIPDPAVRVPLIHGVREGEVTLVRSTHVADAPPDGARSPDAPPPDAAPPGGQAPSLSLIHI